MKQPIAPFGVRMPPELKTALQAQAKENNRSLNSEIVYQLQQQQAATGKQAGKSID